MNASCLDEKGRFKSCPYRVYTDEHMLEDINPNEIVSHILDGTLISWLSSWKMKCGMLTAFLVENDRANMEELETLRRENFGLKTTVKNQREKLDGFYRNP